MGGVAQKPSLWAGTLFLARNEDDAPKLPSRALNLREQLATSLNGLPQEMEEYQPFAENRFCLFAHPFHLAYVAIFFHGLVFILTKTPVN